MAKRYSVIFYTNSDLTDNTHGNSNNDLKFIKIIESRFNVRKIFPKKKSISLLDWLRINLLIIIYSLFPSRIFIFRNANIHPFTALMKKVLRHKLIFNMGCTPFRSIEIIKMEKNPGYFENKNIWHNLNLLVNQLKERLAIKHGDLYFVENKEAKELVQFNNVERKKISIVPYYVQDYFLFGKNPPFLKEKGWTFKIGYTGRFHKYDSLPIVVKSIKILKEKGYNIELNLIGDGPTKIDIIKKVNSLDLNNNVKFHGPKPHKEVSLLIDEFHILVMPMVKFLCQSTVAIKILEGIMKGKIVITTNSGNNKSLFHPYTEFVLENLTPIKLSNIIKEVIENYEFFMSKARKIREKHLKYRTEYNCKIKLLKNLLKL